MIFPLKVKQPKFMARIQQNEPENPSNQQNKVENIPKSNSEDEKNQIKRSFSDASKPEKPDRKTKSRVHFPGNLTL